MTTVPVSMTDAEWRVACEELAKEELAKDELQKQLEAEAEEWKDRKDDLKARIKTKDSRIQQLAREVETRQRVVDAQTDLPFPGSEEATEEEHQEEGDGADA